MDNEIILTTKGLHTNVTLYKNRIEITRTGIGGLMFHGLDGTKIIFIKSITALQFLKNSYLQIMFQGSRESKKGIIDAMKDENSIIFDKKQNDDFEKIKDYIISQL